MSWDNSVRCARTECVINGKRRRSAASTFAQLLAWSTVAMLCQGGCCSRESRAAAETPTPEHKTCNKAFSIWDSAQQHCRCPIGTVDLGSACCQPGTHWSYESSSCTRSRSGAIEERAIAYRKLTHARGKKAAARKKDGCVQTRRRSNRRVHGTDTASSNSPSPCSAFDNTSYKPCVDYTVVDGDTLEIVSAKFGTQPFQIALDNSLPIPVSLEKDQVLAVRPGDGVEVARWIGDPSKKYTGPLDYSYPRPCAGVDNLQDQMACFCSYHIDGIYQWPFLNTGCKQYIQCAMRVPKGGLQTCAQGTVVDDALRYGEAVCTEPAEDYACTEACSDHSCFCREYLLNQGNYTNPFDNDRASFLTCEFDYNNAWFRDLNLCPLGTKADYQTSQCVPDAEAPAPYAVRKGVYQMNYFSRPQVPAQPAASTSVSFSSSLSNFFCPAAPARSAPGLAIAAAAQANAAADNAACRCLALCTAAARDRAQQVGCRIPGCSEPCTTAPSIVASGNPKCKCRLKGLCLQVYACA